MKKTIVSIVIIFSSLLFIANAQQMRDYKPESNKGIKVGAERTAEYLSIIKGKTIAVLANQTSLIGKTHLVDSLVSLGINLKLIFAPEHGFRGNADAGETISNSIDKKTGIPIVSLYGNHQKPSAKDVEGIDIVIFDIQDVGVRFYTFLSTLHYVMEACAENNKTLLLLDRPNPNGFYVDGPVLEKKYASFVGLDPVPIVHGCTMAEMAEMINGENWLGNNLHCNLKYVTCAGYNHSTYYQLPIKPSPNITSMIAVYLYPSLGLFEGTEISVGRGTDSPFEIIGYPGFKLKSFKFIPKSIVGMSKNPPYEGIECNGLNLQQFADGYIKSVKHLYLYWLKAMYDDYPNKAKYFNNFFDSLAGNSTLREQIINGVDEDVIHASWEKDLKKYLTIRKKYLLYEDFEEGE
jgi:uncharacterized protein YbbC (DUF1343 family)